MDENNTVVINGRSYPSRYPPGKDILLDEVWEILDSIKEGVIPMDVRAYLAGRIYAALSKRSNP